MTFPVGSGSSPALKIWCRESALVALSPLCRSGFDHSPEKNPSWALSCCKSNGSLWWKKPKTKHKKKYQATVKKDKDATCVEGFIPGPSALGTEMAGVAFSPAASRSVIKAGAPPPAAIRPSLTLPGAACRPGELDSSFVLIKKWLVS